jgi:hypothetical protein
MSKPMRKHKQQVIRQLLELPARRRLLKATALSAATAGIYGVAPF